MFSNKKLAAGSIVVMKLITGEEVIAKLINDTDGLFVSKPIAIGMTQNGLALMPFMMGIADDASMRFSMDKVVTYLEARKEVKDAYIQNTTGIVPAGGVPEGILKA